jgi:hypothetical protein
MESGIYSEVERMYQNIIKRDTTVDNAQVLNKLARMD